MGSVLLSTIGKLLSQVPANSVLRERIALAKEQAEAIEKRTAQLEEENAQLREQVHKLEDELASLRTPKEFTEHRGALFKRKSDGSWERVVYCPGCKRSTFSLEKMLPYHCNVCKWSADFTGRELEEVMKDLP